MKYIGYDWDCSPNSILLDEEFDTDELGWQDGDYFQLTNIDGKKILKRIDPLYRNPLYQR